MFKKSIIYSLAVATMLFQSCSNFEEINVDPNNPATVPAEMLLPPIISGSVSTMTASGRRAGQYVQHLAYLAADNEADGRYNLTGASWREEWNGAVRLTKDINQLKRIAQESYQPQYEALAHITKVYILSLVTDAYGDIPYDEIGMANVPGLEFARFQSQEEVYQRMLEELETANMMLTNLPTTATIQRDILFNGDLIRWRKFANALKVRILMRQSAKKDVASAIAEIFNNPTQYPVFTGIQDAPTLTYDNQNNFYAWFIQNPPTDGSGVDFSDNARISETMIGLLKRDNDPRLSVYAAPTRNSFERNRANTSAPLEYRGQIAGFSQAEEAAYNRQNNLNTSDFSVVSRRIRQESRAFLMTYSELLLLKAEAIQKQMGVQGDLAAIYKQAVDASFAKWPQVGTSSQRENPYIDQAQQNAYWSNPANAFNPARGMEQIAEQYFVDSFLNGFEGWATWRRVGFPNIKPGPSVLAKIPVRYVYSDNEQNNPKLLEWVNSHYSGKMPDQNVKVWFQP